MATPPFKVKALFDYVSQEEDDLRFKGNQIITVTDEEDADWYYGEYDDESGSKQEGLFPKNFVKALEPEAPPRPVRAQRTKKEPDTNAPSKDLGSPSTGPDLPSTQEPRTAAPPANAAEVEPSQLQAPASGLPLPLEQSREPARTPAAVSNMPKPSPPTELKAVPPSSDKPSSNAFRDRINAFNKSPAPPVAPMKPGNLASGSGFVKKPFVAPPPSKNAYVPPPREAPPHKIYRREEDPGLQADAGEASHEDPQPAAPAAAPGNQEDDQPKPTSLKDRIALLQKQQMEQATRHAESVQKKEKPKKPRKPTTSEEVAAGGEEDEDVSLERVGSTETDGKRSMDAARKRRQSREETPKGAGEFGHYRDILSDGNDADQSEGGDTEEGRDDSDSRPKPRSSIHVAAAPRQSYKPADLQEDASRPADEDEEEAQEEDVDPEVKRRMEIRERMAKMSGGMGMAGMFRPPMPAKPSPQRPSSERKSSVPVTVGIPDSRAPPISIMPMPGMQKVRSPEQAAQPSEVAKESEDQPKSLVQGGQPEDMPDMEDITDKPVSVSRTSTERPMPPISPQDRPAPPPPSLASGRGPPPPPPEGPAPPTPASRPNPPSPPRALLSPSEGSESDDELSSHDYITAGADSSRPSSKEGPPQLSQFHRNILAPPNPSEDTIQEARILSPPNERSSHTLPALSNEHSLPAATRNRAPPPPPHTAPVKRSASGDRTTLHDRSHRQRRETEEEITEYEGDYDTDIASGAGHKDARKAHARAPSLEDDSTTGEVSSACQPGSPSTRPPPAAAWRPVPPPPPPSQPHRQRPSSDMPRGAPPPPPPPKQSQEEEDDEYDPFRYTAPKHVITSLHHEQEPFPRTPTIEEPEPAYSSPPPPPPQHRRLPSASQMQPQSPPSSTMPLSSGQDPQQSSEMHRTSTTIRRSADISRPSGEHYMATDIDLNQGSGWWAQTNRPPPALQSRRDVIYEIDENSTTRRGGKVSVSKEVYVLFMDYSQTQISVQFEASDPGTATNLEQKHEPPPRNLRQDQLEDAHEKFGARIAAAAKSKEGATIGDGTSHAFPYELISSIADALRPVGIRAYGALVYANLANATVQQHDEIRPGDILTFRNAKFGGHRGAVKSKYSIEVGKPDHVGIVVDWDGTRKKVRAWEQGRESKKVKVESFKFGDMKSGEVKVWRVMSRAWVGWEGTN